MGVVGGRVGWCGGLFFCLFLFFKKNRGQNQTRTAKSQSGRFSAIYKNRNSHHGAERRSAAAHYTFPGILARLRAMASSTAFSCFRSSSRRDRVLDLPPLAPVGPGSDALPGTLVTLLELLDWGESWRFLAGERGEGGEKVVGATATTPFGVCAGRKQQDQGVKSGVGKVAEIVKKKNKPAAAWGIPRFKPCDHQGLL